MSGPSVRGACPSLFAPMASGDGLLVRVKPPGSVLSADAAGALARAAARWGNGVIELTRRASLQVRGLAPAGVAPFAAAIVAAGLADADPAVEARRNIVVSPLAGVDEGVCADTGAVAAALAALLARERRLTGLPAKFGFAVDGGGALQLGGVAADIAIRFTGGQWQVIPDGSARAAGGDAGQAAGLAIRLAHAFLDLRAGMADAPRRMQGLVQAVDDTALFGAMPTVAASPARDGEPVLAGRMVAGGFGVGLPFGTVGAVEFRALAAAARLGDGVLRLTPWRTVLIAGVRDLDALTAALAGLDLITAAGDRRIGVAACQGGPACASGTVATRDVAAALARLGLDGTVHVSGCSKGCAHPAPASVTLVGRAGGFDLVRHGRAGDVPVTTGLGAEAAIALLERVPA